MKRTAPASGTRPAAPPKKKRGAAPPEPARAHAPRAVAAAGRRAVSYPSVRKLISAAALATAGGLAASGCAAPECSGTRLGEVETHGQAGVSQLLDLDLGGALESFAVGVGFVPHPILPTPTPFAVAGAEPMVLTSPPLPEEPSEIADDPENEP